MRVVKTGAINTESEVEVKSTGRREWRWALHVSWNSIGLEREWRFHLGEPEETDWLHCYTHVAVMFLPFRWKYGFDWMYYDGTHNQFNLGPLHFYWMG